MNIDTRETIDPNDPPLAGTAAIPSNQGNDATCASHAVGKAVVEILDGFGLDCDQTQVIENLIERMQPNKEALSIERFHLKPCDVVVWGKGQSDDKKNLPSMTCYSTICPKNPSAFFMI